MIREQLFVKSVERGVRGGCLNKDIGTIGVVFYHTLYAADLPLDAVEAVDELFVLRLIALFCFVTSADLGFDFFIISHKYTPYRYLYEFIIYPRRVFVKRLFKDFSASD